MTPGRHAAEPPHDGAVAEHAPGQTRVAVFEGGALVELYIRRDEDTGLWPGTAREGRLVTARESRPLLRLSDGQQAELTGHLPTPLPPDGALLSAVISRAPLPEPGRMKLARAILAADPLPASPDPLAGAHPVSRLPEAADEALSQLAQGTWPFATGMLHLERTRAGLVIDVDGASGQDAQTVNLAAARAVARVLRLAQVGGVCLIDFLATDNKAQRQAIAQAFDEVAAADPRAAERTAVNGYGLLQVVRARPVPSVLDRLWGCNAGAWPDAQAQALDLLRGVVQASGAGERCISAPAAAARWLASQPQLLEQAAQRVGAPVRLLPEPVRSGYGHVHVQHP